LGLYTGLVVAYDRASFGSWRLVSTLAPFDFGNINFGSALRMVGDELWIGAPGSDGAGRIYRSRGDRDGVWSAMTKIGVDTIEAGAQWGASFAVSGDAAIIGMPGDGGGGGTVAFMAKGPGNAWTLRSLAMPPVPEAFNPVTGKEVTCKEGMAGAYECIRRTASGRSRTPPCMSRKSGQRMPLLPATFSTPLAKSSTPTSDNRAFRRNRAMLRISVHPSRVASPRMIRGKVSRNSSRLRGSNCRAARLASMTMQSHEVVDARVISSRGSWQESTVQRSCVFKIWVFNASFPGSQVSPRRILRSPHLVLALPRIF
jgi:hypothetical protein